MALLTKKRVKYALAAVGAAYAVLFVGYLVFAGINRAKPKGPSDLEQHPERQAEILAERRAAEMKDRLSLTDEQVKQLTDIYKASPEGPPGGPPGSDSFHDRMKAQRDAMAKVLTPEQQERLKETRGFGGPGGRGGFRGRMSPERLQELMSKMTPEQQARAQKQLERFQQRRAQRGGPRPDGPPPDAPAPEGPPPPPSN